ncbi:MAG: EAL domain-containing protein [Nitriliruptoraceae bacterium]|nr:EAL domain-containing protein [Nitriliruptoraceae bacterium]
MQQVFGEVLVSRQPIVAADLEVLGYELLYRDEGGHAPLGEYAGIRATATVLIDGLLALGREVCTDGTLAFVNVPGSMLQAGTLLDLPSDGLVIELLESLDDDERTREAIERHREVGFRFALDDVVPGDPRLGMAHLVDAIKVDLEPLTLPEALAFIRELVVAGHEVIAEKVETPEVFDAVIGAGAHAVQGFFFTRPRAVRAMRPLGLTPTHLQLMRALALSEVDLHEVEDLIRSDLTLTDRFLRLVDVATGWRDVESIHHALVLLGERRVHRWVSLLVMSAVTNDAPSELLTTASVRARYCEDLQERRGQRTGLEAFALGMFSVLGADGIVDPRVLGELPLPEEVRSALQGGAGTFRDLIDLCLAAERADWAELVGIGRRLGLEPAALAAAHLDAVRWAHRMQAA